MYSWQKMSTVALVLFLVFVSSSLLRKNFIWFCKKPHHSSLMGSSAPYRKRASCEDWALDPRTLEVHLPCLPKEPPEKAHPEQKGRMRLRWLFGDLNPHAELGKGLYFRLPGWVWLTPCLLPNWVKDTGLVCRFCYRKQERMLDSTPGFLP